LRQFGRSAARSIWPCRRSRGLSHELGGDHDQKDRKGHPQHGSGERVGERDAARRARNSEEPNERSIASAHVAVTVV
jgi:hypothetical protein